MFNDADIEMAELAQGGRDIANGVCPICDDMLDPEAPKWASSLNQTHDRYGRELPERSVNRLSGEAYKKLVGPHSNVVEGYHDWCLEQGV